MAATAKQKQFIEDIAGYVQKYAPQYGILCNSAVIAQAILESGWGETSLAYKYHNYFGLKCGTLWTGPSVNLSTKEEYTQGTLTTIQDNFRVYISMEEGVKGYFEFIQLKRYQNLRGIKDPQQYLETIRADGYATSYSYVTNTMKCVTIYNLTQYDGSTTAKEAKATVTKTEKATQWMINLANDDSHGYDQIYRWGERGDFDCSSAVITAWETSGVPVKSKGGATYTGNMYSAFIKNGFRDVTSKVNLSTGSGCVRGDVLLNVSHHTAMYIGSGQEVEASINERGGATGGTPGDQTGQEIKIRSYRNYPWDYVLRYEDSSEEADPDSDTDSKVLSTVDIPLHQFLQGAEHAEVKVIQLILKKLGFRGADGNKLKVDGVLGDNTVYALTNFQKAHGMEGINFGSVSTTTWKYLFSMTKK